MRQARYCGLILFLLILFPALWIPRLRYLSETERLDDRTVSSPEFRSQPLTDSRIDEIKEISTPGELLGIYWLETDFGQEKVRSNITEMSVCRARWELRPGWSSYISACSAVWDDLNYFPVAESTDGTGPSVSFEDSWMYGRSYGGDRGHEGTDIMPSVNERGVLPVVSMTDGVVESKGWLELGGYRLGIRAPHGGYFYYAHLDSYADLEEGDRVNAGDLLGYMGDTGYSKIEGTTGNFPVHLHLGIYVDTGKEEVSVNPYPALRYVEDKVVRYK